MARVNGSKALTLPGLLHKHSHAWQREQTCNYLCVQRVNGALFQ